MQAFGHGELMQTNVPPSWDGGVMTTRLGMRWYRDALYLKKQVKEELAAFSIVAAHRSRSC